MTSKSSSSKSVNSTELKAISEQDEEEGDEENEDKCEESGEKTAEGNLELNNQYLYLMSLNYL